MTRAVPESISWINKNNFNILETFKVIYLLSEEQIESKEKYYMI